MSQSPERYGVAAYPVNHSLTPFMYQAAFQQFGMNATCEKFNIHIDRLEGFIQTLRSETENPMKGLAISLTLKEGIMKHLDEIDPVAREIGAVNTLKIDHGKFTGYNTDWIGITHALEQYLTSEKPKLHSLKYKKVLVIGGRGAARAAVYALKHMGAHIYITNRTAEYAERIGKEFDTEVLPYNFDNMQETFDMVINTTSIGLDCYASPTPIQFWEEHGNGLAFDVVYRPMSTRFLHEAARAGWDTIPGQTMLARQGIAQFKILAERDVDASLFDEAIEQQMKEYQKSHARFF